MAKNVTLHINKTNPNNPKYTPVTVGSATYYYMFTGGNYGAGNGNGGNEFKVKDKIQTFTITFGATPGATYTFPPLAFINKNSSTDLTSANSSSKVVVLDICSKTGSWDYGVTVRVGTNGATFVCDPVIKNTW